MALEEIGKQNMEINVLINKTTKLLHAIKNKYIREKC